MGSADVQLKSVPSRPSFKWWQILPEIHLFAVVDVSFVLNFELLERLLSTLLIFSEFPNMIYYKLFQ